MNKVLGVSFLLLGTVTWADTCLTNPERQKLLSEQLVELAVADQTDRENWQQKSDEELEQVKVNDLERRIKVADIFAEGCLKSAEDYVAAAYIYQHGEVPDHIFQALVWALRAISLNHKDNLNELVATTADRYLVSNGKKQLFGTQAYFSSRDACFCLEPIEPSFPETLRKQYTSLSLKERFDWVQGLNAEKGMVCQVKECSKDLKPTKKGDMPEVW